MYRSSFDTRRAVETEDEVTEEVVRPAAQDCSTGHHTWKYLTDADKLMKRTSFHMGQRMISNAPMPDADCTQCSMVLFQGEACHWSPFGRVARPWNGN